MYAFTPDGATLLFVDCFSLTRVILPGKVKNDRKVTGSSGAHVSVSSDGAQALSWQDAFNRVILWELPALKASRRLDRFAHSKAWLHWKGGALVKHGVDALEIVDLATDASESFSLAGGE
ncbi:MAG: hypothetical protein KC636_23385, partial [Myxococcales bacterium]|nr:hypothetical protein [Myxococcales bacterium]